MDILQTIAAKTAERVALKKNEISFEEIKKQAETLADGFDGSYAFYNALKKDGISLICEVKKASPSKGVIAEDFDYLSIARDYEQGGASAVSVLTEPHWFLGSDAYLQAIRREIQLPVLRKDFTVDDYQIYEAKVLGADAVLLICAITEETDLKRRIALARQLGLSALVETHNSEEIETAVRCGADIIGVNNRNLADFSVDIGLSASLRKLVPEHIVFVAESGVTSAEQVRALANQGVDAVLIGETLMRAENRTAAVRKFVGAQ